MRRARVPVIIPLALASALLALASVVPSSTQVPARADARSVRIHHLHFRVGDPSAAMQSYADRLSGSRVLLQGLGVGVRVGAHYLLFDRDRGQTPAIVDRPDPIQAAYRAAVPWLAAHGLVVQTEDLSTLPLGSLGDPPPLDHLAFVSADFAGTVDLMIARGAQPVSRTADAAMFALPDGTRVEIVPDTDAPDAFWCPMHLDVRSGTPGKCPVCAMAFVPIPPPRLGEYRMDVAVEPGTGGRGLGRLRLRIREPGGSVPVSDFTTMHERLLHLFIVSRDLEYFAHVHPQSSKDGVFTLTHAAPPGEYVVIADFLPKAGTSQMVHRAIVTPGYAGRLFAERDALKPDVPPSPRFSLDPAAPVAARWSSAEKTVDGVRIRMEVADLVAGKRATLRFRLSDATSGNPISDLEPLLGAPGHLLIVNGGLTDSIHEHPEESQTSGPLVTFMPLVPAPGTYKLWVQFQRSGRILTAAFVIAASEP